jgi:hypothetical protein
MSHPDDNRPNRSFLSRHARFYLHARRCIHQRYWEDKPGLLRISIEQEGSSISLEYNLRFGCSLQIIAFETEGGQEETKVLRDSVGSIVSKVVRPTPLITIVVDPRPTEKPNELRIELDRWQSEFARHGHRLPFRLQIAAHAILDYPA